MDNIEKDINEIMEYIKDLKEENRKQKEILDILKVESCIIWVENGELYSGRYGDIQIPLDEWDFNGKENQDVIKEWLNGKD